MRPRIRSILGSSTIALALSLSASTVAAQAHAPADHGDGPFSTERAAELFRSSCSVCHTVPDTTFGTDRAWVEQVYDTA